MAKHKTDRDDALKLAKLTAVDPIKPTHVPNHEMRDHR